MIFFCQFLEFLSLDLFAIANYSVMNLLVSVLVNLCIMLSLGLISSRIFLNLQVHIY